MEKLIIEQLKKAISQIDSKYFDRNEREFVAELYHQVRLKETKNNQFVSTETSKNKAVHVDDNVFNDLLISKYLLFGNSMYANTNGYYRRTPDLLFHDYIGKNKQLLAVEVKPTNSSHIKIAIDLAKLVVYCKGGLKYERGILILFGKQDRKILIEFPDIKELLTKYPEIEIWVIKRNYPPLIINANYILINTKLRKTKKQ